MNTITRQTATDEQLENIYAYIHSYVDILQACLENVDELDLPIEDSLKIILGLGIKEGYLAKFENMSKIVNDEISFDVWIRVNLVKPPLYYKLKTVVNLAEKRAQVIEEE